MSTVLKKCRWCVGPRVGDTRGPSGRLLGLAQPRRWPVLDGASEGVCTRPAGRIPRTYILSVLYVHPCSCVRTIVQTPPHTPCVDLTPSAREKQVGFVIGSDHTIGHDTDYYRASDAESRRPGPPVDGVGRGPRAPGCLGKRGRKWAAVRSSWHASPIPLLCSSSHSFYPLPSSTRPFRSFVAVLLHGVLVAYTVPWFTPSPCTNYY